MATKKSSVEVEFKKLQEQVNAKLAQASSLIIEASKLASSAGKELVDEDGYPSDDFDAIGLHRAMESAGWNTSGWYC